MQIIPTLELLDGRCVTLRKGRLDDPALWHVDPVETACGFAQAGAPLIRITDFDAIKGGTGNDALIAEIIRKAGAAVQVAGGVRSVERARHWFDTGAAQVVVGTLAVMHPDSLVELAKFHPDMVMLNLDIWQGKLMTHGWGTASALDPAAFIRAFDSAPLAGIIVTDIDSDIDEVDAQLGLISGLAAEARFPVIASGVVETLDDISRLKFVPNIAGAVVGRALMNRSFTLEEALALAGSRTESVAEFL